MINLNKARKLFKQYVSNYDLENPKIALKIKHTYRVMEMSNKLALSLGLSKEDVDLATLIGLLHDIGRFEQLKRYNSYFDNQTIDHALLGVEILFNDNFILEFVDDKELLGIIYKAIYNHNKYKIEDNLTKRELLHAKIIRDSDKIDIFNTGLIEPFEAFVSVKKEILENDTISDKVYQTVMNNESVLITDRKTELDRWISFMAMVFDLYFSYSYCYIYEHDYVNQLFDRLNYSDIETKNRVSLMKKHINDYLLTKI